MKKFLFAMLAIASLALTACGNEDISWGSFSFHKVHIQMYSMEKPVHLEIEKWKEDSGGIELKTKNHGTILLGDGTYMMYDTDNCPLCGDVEYN